MSAVRSDIWCAAFVRRHNGLGNFCVVARKGDAIAGQVWIEVDHLDGTRSLHTQMSSAAQGEGDGDRVFRKRFERVEPERIAERIAREIDFDPDIWVLSLDMRGDDIGV